MHSGDSACAIPPPTLAAATVLQTIEAHTRALADALDVVRSAQRAVRGEGRRGVRDRGEPAREPHGAVREQGDRRAAREGRGAVDGRRDARRAARRRVCCARPPKAATSSVKEAVLPFNRFPDVDTLLGPEMRSTGEVMGIDRTFGMAFAKSQAARGQRAAARRARCSSRSPTATSRPGSSRRAASPSSGSRSSATAGTAAALEAERDPGRDGRGQGRRGPVGRRRGRPHLVGQGRPGREHAPRPRARGPTACTSAGPRSSHGVAVRHHGRRRARRRGRDRRGGQPRAGGAVAAGVPPRRPAPAGGLSGAAPPRRACRRVDLGGRARAARAAEPDRRGVGHVRPRRRGRAAVRSGAARRGHGEVASPRTRGTGNPRAASAPDAGGGMLNAVGLPGPGVDAWIAARPARARSASARA